MAANPTSIDNVPAKIKKLFTVVSFAPIIRLIPDTMRCPGSKRSGQWLGTSCDDLTKQALCHQVFLDTPWGPTPCMRLRSWGWDRLASTAAAPGRLLHASDRAERFPPGRCCQAALKRSHTRFTPEFLLPSLMVLTIVSRSLSGFVL